MCVCVSWGQCLVMISWQAAGKCCWKREEGNKKIVKELVAEGCIVGGVEGVSDRLVRFEWRIAHHVFLPLSSWIGRGLV